MAPSPRDSRGPSERTARIQIPPSTDIPPVDAFEKTVLMREVAEAPRQPSASPPPPTTEDLFHFYTVLGKIGDGGMGVVYLARDKRLGRFVAIKRLNSHIQAIASLRQRFLQEARAVAALSHSHIVHIYALGEDPDGPYIVMEYVAGPDTQPAPPARGREDEKPTPPLTLDQFVTRNGQLAMIEAVELMIKVGRAVAYAHGCGVIHRDLKPSNVLLDKAREPKIVDFGLARLRHSDESKLTVPGEKLLSLGYGAPEQEQDASLSDERADVYGLGAILYFAITGQNPRYFREQDTPVPLRDVLVKALATDREQRFASAAAFTDALLATQNKTRIEVPTVKTTWRCKWCDAVNPLSLRFCAECGWDGGEACPECGGETFVGMQFCGTCGADARAYEAMHHVLQRMQTAAEQRQFQRVVSLAGRTHGFEAAGPAGRTLQKQAQALREQAERNLSRRDDLREQIPLEMRAENFERARAFIEEIRRLDGNPRLCEEEERRIPELTLARDLNRLRRATRLGDSETAARLCAEILRVSPEHAECLRLRRRLALRIWRRRAASTGALVVATLLLYLLSLPPFALAAGAPRSGIWRVLYRPAAACYAAGPLHGMLGRYLALWGQPDVGLRKGAAAPTPDAAATAPRAAELQRVQGAYNQQILEIASAQRAFAEAWPRDYLQDLDTLMERRRTAGDFEGWAVTQAERKQFYASRQIGGLPDGNDFPELAQVMKKYRDLLSGRRLDRCRKLVVATKKYINDLTDLQRALTREGRMETASAVNAEIRRVQGSGELQEAEAQLSSAGADDVIKPEPVAVLSGMPPEHVAELDSLRARYQDQMDGVATDYTRRRDEWPGKYRAALTNLMLQFKQQGSYDDWNAATRELDRFEVDRQIQPKDIAPQPLRLAKLQKDHLDLLVQYRRVSATGVVKASDDFIAQLEELQKLFTRRGDMERAATVNAEIRQLRASSAYKAARAELAPPPPPDPAATNRPPAVPIETAAAPGGR